MRTQILPKFYLYFFCTLSIAAAEYESLEEEEYLSADKQTTSFYSPGSNARSKYAKGSDWKASAKKVLPYIATGIALSASGATYYMRNNQSGEALQNRNGPASQAWEANEEEAEEEAWRANKDQAEDEDEPYLSVKKVSPNRRRQEFAPKRKIVSNITASQSEEKAKTTSKPKKKTILSSPPSLKPVGKTYPYGHPIQRKKGEPSIASTLYSPQGKQLYRRRNNGMEQPSAPMLSSDSDNEVTPLSITQQGDGQHIEQENSYNSGSDMVLVTPSSETESIGFIKKIFKKSKDNKSKKKPKKKDQKSTKKKKKKKQKNRLKKESKKKNTKKKKKKQKSDDSFSELSSANDTESDSDDNSSKKKKGRMSFFGKKKKRKKLNNEGADDDIEGVSSSDSGSDSDDNSSEKKKGKISFFGKNNNKKKKKKQKLANSLSELPKAIDMDLHNV